MLKELKYIVKERLAAEPGRRAFYVNLVPQIGVNNA
jgi:hypothetical protein